MIKIDIEPQYNESLFSRRWEIGSCYGPKKMYDDEKKIYVDQYESNSTYIDMCCIGPGTNTLRCVNSIGPYGWGRSSIEIQGQRYCDDFVGNKGLRRVVAEGK